MGDVIHRIIFDVGNTVTIPLDVYNVLVERKAQVDAMERFYTKKPYLSKEDVQYIFNFDDIEDKTESDISLKDLLEET